MEPKRKSVRQPTNQWERLVVKPKDHDAGRICRRMPRDVGEVTIEGDERSALASDNGQEVIVSRSRQVLFPSERYVVAGSPENRRDAVGHVLIELDGGHR